MAPALNEPMSPTEKLSSSTANATPPPTRSIKSVSDTESSPTPTPMVNSCNANDQKEKRSGSFSLAVSTASSLTSHSTRLTRSKDAYQRVFEQSVSPAVSVTISPPTTPANETSNTSTAKKKTVCKTINTLDSENEKEIPIQKDSRNSNESTGMSESLHNNRISSDDEKNITEPVFLDAGMASEAHSKVEDSNINNNNNTSISCKSNSTEQLLADLTTDIEETITTKVCIRKDLKVNVDDYTSNVSSLVTSSEELGTKNIDILEKGKSESRDLAITTTPDSKIEEFQRLEITAERGSGKNQITSGSTSKTHTLRVTETNEKNRVCCIGDATETQTQTSSISETTPVPSSISTDVSDTVHVITRKPEATTRLQILSVDVLPPISTDSTMTASEVEDNLEERLSQLDGTAVASPMRDDANSLNANVGISIVPTTPPRTPTKQQTHQQQVKQLQQQLQQTPPTPLSQHINQQQHIQQQQHTFTPQSTSSINTLSSANLPPAFMKESGAGELEDQDIEEVLKVLKGFDGSAGADTLCDLNVLFNEEYTLINYEEVSSQPASTSIKPSPLKEMQSEIERNQQTMYRRIDFLLRRMRKIQSRYMSKHCSEEIAGLFEWTARIYADKSGNGNIDRSNLLQTDTAISVIAARPPASNWAEEKNPVSSSQMSSMLRRLEQSSNAQQLCMMTTNNNLNSLNTQIQRKSKKAILQDLQTSASTSTGATAISVPVERKGEIVVPNYDINVSEEMSQVAGLLQTEMREVQMAMDSDATESSSGGESADEMVTYNNQIQQPLAIAKRAAWRYSRDRAAIAARWSWLLSQIADLEIKIRQHTELRQEIVRTKGAVVSGMEESTAGFHGSSLKAIETGAAVNTVPSSVNGYKGIIVGNSCNKNDAIETNETLGAARTRGFMPALFRKRKLLQTQSLHTISKKAARPSNIKCGCQWPFNPCALCTGRIDPTAPRDPPDTMMMADRIALLDPCYHPVLSFREDVSSTLHLEAIARMPEWQQRIMRCQVKSIAKSVWRAERDAERAAGHSTSKKYNEPAAKRRYIKKKDRLAAEERNAAVAAAATGTVAGTTTPNTSNAPTSIATTDSTDNLTTTGAGVGVGIIGGGVLAEGSASSAIITSSLPAGDAGNGTGTLSTSSSSTTPLVANKSAIKNSKKLHHYHLVGDGVLLEPPLPLSPVATNHSSHSQSSHHSQQSGNSNSNTNIYIHQTSDNHPQNYDQYNPTQIHSSLISNNSNGFSGGGGGGGSGAGGNGGNHKNSNKQRKGSASNMATGIINSNNSGISSNSSNNNSTISYHHNYYGDSNDANWDSFASRSRTSSPTHTSFGGGSSSNYYKYERSKNRTSYDIDNIVIPYSVAAATRVEILPYKEIPTPKWRVIEEDRKGVHTLGSIIMDASPGKFTSSGDNSMSIDGCDNCESSLDKNLPSIDSTSLNATKLSKKGEIVDVTAIEKKVVTEGESIQSIASNDSETGSKDASMKSDSLIINSVKISEVKNNLIKSNNCTLISVESENKKVADDLISKSDVDSHEPAEKKGKIEDSTENNDFSISIVTSDSKESKSENMHQITAVPTKISRSNSKRKMRLRHNSTAKGKSRHMDMEVAAETSESEDITDNAIMLRHERALVEERRKFKTYLKFPWSTRSRANRRIDSRAESSGANTPDPTSPAPQTPSIGGGDQESIPSPLAPSTPLNPLDVIAENGDSGANNLPPPGNNGLSKHLERRRTTSTKKERDFDRRSSTPDPRELVPPYEPLQFPLTDDAFDGLLKAMPIEFHYLDFDSKYLEDCNSAGAFSSAGGACGVGGIKNSRQRTNWRGGDGLTASSRRGKLSSTMQNCDVMYNKRQRNSCNNSRRGGISGGGGGGGRGRRRGNQQSNSRIKSNDGLSNGTHGGGGNNNGRDVNGEGEDVDDDDDDDDEIDLLTILAEEEDDCDYPKHHLAPDDDLFDGGGGVNGTTRNRIMDIDAEYDAYLGRQHRDSDGDTTDSEPFADDDPNDPEWRGESDERGGGGGFGSSGGFGGSERYRRTFR